MQSHQVAERIASVCSDSILVTGGAGFIGSNFVLSWLGASAGPVVNLEI
jgi:dTDP-glucose 4,6-dehydratase